jgi:hypothetical protein
MMMMMMMMMIASLAYVMNFYIFDCLFGLNNLKKLNPVLRLNCHKKERRIQYVLETLPLKKTCLPSGVELPGGYRDCQWWRVTIHILQ